MATVEETAEENLPNSLATSKANFGNHNSYDNYKDEIFGMNKVEASGPNGVNGSSIM